nr:retrovirus-related Pol polyprotein from transposon TNT 1-94 [Tanacetum cinerariifolium]
MFKTVGLIWVPTGKIFASSITKVDSEPLIGSNVDITNQYECKQTLDVSAGTLNLSAGTSFNLKEEGIRVCLELRLHDHSNEQSSSKLVPDVYISTINSYKCALNQPLVSEYRWTKDHPLEQVRGNPSRPVQTRRQLAIDPEMCMYALTQAPRVWYDELSTFLTSKGFTKGLQIYQSPSGIFINQAKYTLEILHKHGMEKGQSISTTIATKPKLDADLSGNPVDQTDYRSDKLVSWMSKKQNCTAVSLAEAKYVALSASCAQVM